MNSKGRYFSEEMVRRIVQLLSTTDMTVKEIAERVSCSPNAIGVVNRKYQIRQYAGFRSHWRMGGTGLAQRNTGKTSAA